MVGGMLCKSDKPSIIIIIMVFSVPIGIYHCFITVISKARAVVGKFVVRPPDADA